MTLDAATIGLILTILFVAVAIIITLRRGDRARQADTATLSQPGATAPNAAPLPEAVQDTPIPIAPANGAPDNLLLIKGLGPKLVSVLETFGITRFDQIAAWDDAMIAHIDAQLGPFKGRIQRDRWIEQARLLAAGDIKGFEARFGKLDC